MRHRKTIAAVSALLIISGPAFAQEQLLWREVESDNLVFMELPAGKVTIELNPVFAPKTVEQFRDLVKDRFYDGLGFYRVIDGFVAQGGDGSDLGELSDKPTIDAIGNENMEFGAPNNLLSTRDAVKINAFLQL